MKKLILLFTFVSVAIVVKAQVGYNYKEFGIGLDISYERGYTNVNRQDQHFGESVSFTYNYSPYIPITAELQFGNLSGGGLTPALDRYGRQYNNHFEGLILHGDFQLGEVIDYSESFFNNVLKGFYFGSGGGIIFNSNTVQRTNIYYGENGLPYFGPSTYVFPGSNSSINLTIPLRFGYEFKIFNEYEEPFMTVNIGYVHSLVFGEGLDGYDDPSNKFKNNATNQYRQIVVGVKFNFGNVTSYNKVIRQL
ncbi:MAG TPA: hypothetical protein VK671_17765 [Mucilaginibacter sp.]|nr:hypothetical protein [Mucilaginibacter sp.]